MKIKSFTVAALAATALSTGFVGAASATTLNFDQNEANNPTGTVSYDGNGGSLNGSNISFTYLNVDSGGDQLVCTDRCMLNFSTGANTNEGSIYSFSGGGNFTLTGTLAQRNADGSAGQSVTSGDSPILSGSFVGQQNGTRGASSFSLTSNGNTTVSDDLLAYLGLDSDTPFSFLNSILSFGQTTYDDNGGFTGQLTAADLNVRDVPEPSEIALFGMGLLLVGGGLYARRRA